MRVADKEIVKYHKNFRAQIYFLDLANKCPKVIFEDFKIKKLFIKKIKYSTFYALNT